MLTRIAKRGRVLIFTLGVLIGSGFLGPMTADAGHRRFAKKQRKALHCQPPKSQVRTQSRTCPATKFRPPMTVWRACCENRGGKVQCHPFPYCPARSPS